MVIFKVTYADYENKTTEAIADNIDCSVHKKPVNHDDDDGDDDRDHFINHGHGHHHGDHDDDSDENKRRFVSRSRARNVLRQLTLDARRWDSFSPSSSAAAATSSS